MSRPLFLLQGLLPLTPKENRRKIDLAFETKPLPPLDRHDIFFLTDVVAWSIVAFLLIAALWIAVASNPEGIMAEPILDAMQVKMTAYELREHAALFAEAQRPVESLSDEYLDQLRARMDAAQQFTWPSVMKENL